MRRFGHVQRRHGEAKVPARRRRRRPEKRFMIEVKEAMIGDTSVRFLFVKT